MNRVSGTSQVKNTAHSGGMHGQEKGGRPKENRACSESRVNTLYTTRQVKDPLGQVNNINISHSWCLLLPATPRPPLAPACTSVLLLLLLWGRDRWWRRQLAQLLLHLCHHLLQLRPSAPAGIPRPLLQQCSDPRPLVAVVHLDCLAKHRVRVTQLGQDGV